MKNLKNIFIIPGLLFLLFINKSHAEVLKSLKVEVIIAYMYAKVAPARQAKQRKYIKTLVSFIGNLVVVSFVWGLVLFYL